MVANAGDIDQARVYFVRAWTLLVRRAGLKEAKRFALSTMKLRKPEGPETQFLRNGIAKFARHGEKISPKEMAAALSDHSIAPIPGTDTVEVRAAKPNAAVNVLAEIIRDELRSLGATPQEVERMAKEVFDAFFEKTFGKSVKFVYPEAVAGNRRMRPSLAFPKTRSLERKIARIKKQQGLSKPYSQD